MKFLLILDYKNLDRSFGCDLATTKVILKTLAQFHALPLALNVTYPEKFNQSIKPHMDIASWESPWTSQEGSKTAIIEVLKESVPCLKTIPKIKRYLDLENGANTTKTSSRHFHTICHNDMWTKNILMKFERGDPVKVKIIGHLFHTFDSIVRDIILFFLTSVRTRVLRHHLDDLLRFYYQNFIQTLKNLKTPVANLTYELFLREFSICTSQVICNGLFLLLFVINDKDNGSNNSPIDPPILNSRDEIPLTAKEKVWWFVEECEKRGWLNN